MPALTRGSGMTEAVLQDESGAQLTPAPRRSRGTVLLGIGIAMLVLMLVATVLGPLIAPHGAAQTSPNSLAGPSAAHWLGTDTFVAVALAVSCGLVLGLASGYLGGWVDQAVMRALDIVFAFPVFLLAIAVVAALGPSVPNLILTIAIVYTPTLARVVRGPVLSIKRWDHVEAARSVGVSEFAMCCPWSSPRSWSRPA